MSRCCIFVLALALCAGCDSDATESTDSEQTNTGGEGGGTGVVGGLILPSNDMIDSVSGGGTIGRGNNPAPGDVQAPANPQQGNVPAQPQDVIQPQRAADLVDKAEAMAANPNLVEVSPDVEAGDYITAIADSYFSAASRVHLLALQHELELERNLNPDYEYPTFEKFTEVLARHNIELKGLRANQVYAYDEATGTVCILEDQSAD